MAGYLAVWAAAGVPAYGLAWLAGWLTARHPSAAHVMAVAVFAVCGLYQLSNLKDRCLAHCRCPLGLLGTSGREYRSEDSWSVPAPRAPGDLETLRLRLRVLELEG